MIHGMKRFCEQLREARKAAGYSSQEKFADVIGMKRTQYLLYETGSKLPDPEVTVPRIADGLGLSYEEVMAWWRLDGATPEEEDAVIAAIEAERKMKKLSISQERAKELYKTVRKQRDGEK